MTKEEKGEVKEEEENVDGDGKQPEKREEPFAVFPDAKSFMERLKRESKQQLEALAKEMGFDSTTAMQQAAKASKEAEEKSKSELEKEREKRAAAESAAEAAREEAKQRLIQAEFKIKAKDVGAYNPDKVFKVVDQSTLDISDDGQVAGIDEALAALKESDPYLFAGMSKEVGAKGSPAGGGQKPNETSIGEKLGQERADKDKSLIDSQSLYFK